jgi:hypothetical protein
MNADRAARSYAALVAAIALGWWLVIGAEPGAAEPFFWAGLPTTVFYSFFPADLFFVVLPAFAYAWTGRRAWWYVFVGSFGYAAVLTIMLCYRQESAWLGAILMAIGAVLNVALTWAMRSHETPGTHN